ncbi:MAG: SPOR domain-containing protein, partial [Acetobacteraceae bacterium]
PGLRYGGGTVMLASARHVTGRHVASRHGSSPHETRLARLHESRAEHRGGLTRVAMLLPPPPPPGSGRAEAHRYERGFHLISHAEAAPIPTRSGGGNEWAIQVGAFTSAAQAEHAAGAAKADAHKTLGSSHPAVASVHQGHGVLWRARLTGMSKGAALHACEKLAHGHSRCMVVSPASQS